MKTFEIPAIGVPMVTSWTAYQESLFGEAGAAYFDSPADLKRTVKMVLKDDDYRRRMADVGRGEIEPQALLNPQRGAG